MAGRLAIRRAAALIRAGGVIAYPTEAVWGLGCNPVDADAVHRILAIKQRDADMGFILIAADYDQLRPWLEPVSREIEARMLARWPGPVTWVAPAQAWVPEWVHGGRGTVAVRVTSHRLCADLCRETGFAIVSTSANRSGRPPARTGAQVRRWFDGELDLILDGATGGRDRPSEILDAVSGQRIRAS